MTKHVVLIGHRIIEIEGQGSARVTCGEEIHNFGEADAVVADTLGLMAERRGQPRTDRQLAAQYAAKAFMVAATPDGQRKREAEQALDEVYNGFGRDGQITYERVMKWNGALQELRIVHTIE